MAQSAEEPVKPAFHAGSYGRVQFSSDLEGGGGDRLSLAHHGPRLGLAPYLELDLGWTVPVGDDAMEVLVTPALSGDLFHYDGDFGDDLALRNLYVESHGIFGQPLRIWAGSRMYRGDDVYLLDFWPLDNLNTYGGGAIYAPGRSEVAVHVGLNRLFGDDWQFQEVTVAVPQSVSGETVVFLDRQRTIASMKASQRVEIGKVTLRAKLYGEIHSIPEGARVDDEAFAELLVEDLPADRGSAMGIQLSAWGWAPQSFVHLWGRRSTGLASYGELTIPVTGLAPDLSAHAARSWLLALAGNHETRWVGVMGAAYLGTWADADGQQVDFDDRTEVVAAVRPHVYVTDHLAIAAEASREWIRPNGANPRTDELDRPQITQLSFLPGIQVARGGYSRPRLQLVYTATLSNQDALDFFAPEDARVRGKTQHFVGMGAEWWVNSRRAIVPG